MARYGLLKPSRNNSERLTWDNSDFDRRKSDQADLEGEWNLELGAKYRMLLLCNISADVSYVDVEM